MGWLYKLLLGSFSERMRASVEEAVRRPRRARPRARARARPRRRARPRARVFVRARVRMQGRSPGP